MDSMEPEHSLVKLMNSDDDFLKRYEKKKIAVKKDRIGLSNVAKSYEQKYEKEIIEGTKKKQLLLESGTYTKEVDEKDDGKCMLDRFVPSRDTPILNMLYFMLYEYKDANEEVQYSRADDDKGTEFNKLKDSMNTMFAGLIEEVPEKDIPELMEFIYKNVTLDVFNKIKKLKALSKSNNIDEATLAYGKCLELCRKFNLEYDRVPCNVE